MATTCFIAFVLEPEDQLSFHDIGPQGSLKGMEFEVKNSPLTLWYMQVFQEFIC